MTKEILNYLIQANLYLILFYGLYWLLLKRETFFQWNRFYLLSSVVVALLIPVIPIPEIITEAPVVQELQQYNPTNFVEKQAISKVKKVDAIKVSTQTKVTYWAWQDYTLLASLAIIGLLFLRFLLNLYTILKLTWKYKKEKFDKYYLVKVPESLPNFSFFNYVFLSNKKTLTEEDLYKIIQHEIIHAKQWHSIDILFFELLTVLFWFNPITYLYKKSIRNLHEYLVDKTVVKKGINKESYIELLVGQFLETEKFKLINHFSNISSLKLRLKMLQKTSSKRYWKFLWLMPILAFCLVFSSCMSGKDNEENTTENQEELAENTEELSEETEKQFEKRQEKIDKNQKDDTTNYDVKIEDDIVSVVPDEEVKTKTKISQEDIDKIHKSAQKIRNKIIE